MNDMQQNPNLMSYNLMHQPPTEDFNKFMQDMTMWIEQITLALSGYRRMVNPRTGEEELEEVEGLRRCNKTGVEYIRMKLVIYMNPNNYMAKYDKNNIPILYQEEMEAFVDQLAINKEEFEMDIDKIDEIETIVGPCIWAALNKALSDKDATYQNTRLNYSNTSTDANNPSGGGLLGRLKI